MRVRGVVRVRGFDELRSWLQCSIDDVLCVSFDIFDTLLRRCIEPPGNLQRRVAELLADRLDMGIHSDAILQARLETEAELRRSALFNGRDHECHFDSLAEDWIRRLVGDSDPDLVKFVHSTERDIESCALSAKPAAVDMLNWLRDCGVRVIAVSDMYLSHAHITRLLDSCGVGQLLDRIYVSSEFGVGKYSGRLYAKVLELEKLDPQDLVHVGDNFMSDVLATIRVGIRGVFLDEPQERQRRRRQTLSANMARLGGMWKGRHFFEVVEQRMARVPENGFFFRYGAEVLGAAFCTFTLGLAERLEAFKPDKVFFVARDGFVFQKLFERWRQLENTMQSGPELVYVFASRHTVANASLVDGLSWEQAIVAFYNPKQQGLLSILRSYGLPTEEFREAAVKHGFENIAEPIWNWRDPRLLAFLDDNKVQNMIRSHGQRSRDLLRRYFEQSGFFSAQRVAVVDIGWNGTIQKYLHDAFRQLPGYPDVRGFYFAFVGALHGDCGLGDRMEGLIYDFRRGHVYERAPRDFEEIFEQGARARDGTTCGYREDNGRVVPILKADHMPDRQAELQCDSMIEECQAGIMCHMDHFHAAVRLTGYDFDDLKPYVLGILERAVAYPTPEEVEHIGKLVHTEDFGHDHTLDISSEPVGYCDLLRPGRLYRQLQHRPWRFASFASLGNIIVTLLFRLASLYLGDRKRI